jgi:hypothetical protein
VLFDTEQMPILAVAYSLNDGSTRCTLRIITINWNSRAMNSSLEGIKYLIRSSEGLPNNCSQTEVNHYAAEVLNRLEHGDNIETLERYLRRLTTPSSRQFCISSPAHNLAERVFVLFSNSRHGD